jgi:hypothetical protein
MAKVHVTPEKNTDSMSEKEKEELAQLWEQERHEFPEEEHPKPEPLRKLMRD